jgi:hypothetical protein
MSDYGGSETHDLIQRFIRHEDLSMGKLIVVIAFSILLHSCSQ